MIPKIIPVLKYFTQSTGDFRGSEKLHIKVADARRFVNASRKKYDVIVADLFHPSRDGAGFLYTVEHFSAIRSHLNPGGFFCQWLPLYQMDTDTLRVILRTFLKIFPDGRAFLAHFSLRAPIVGLIAGSGPLALPSDWMASRVKSAELQKELSDFKLDDPFALLGCFLAGSEELKSFAGVGPLNEDDRPIVNYKAPFFVYSQQEPAYLRLLSLIERFHPKPEDILDPDPDVPDQQMPSRLDSYWVARNHFIHAGVGVDPATDLRTLLGRVREPLLEVVRESPDFAPAYNPLLAMARQLYRQDPEEARALLIELEKANPIRKDAGRLLDALR